MIEDIRFTIWVNSSGSAWSGVRDNIEQSVANYVISRIFQNRGLLLKSFILQNLRGQEIQWREIE